ncbi:MAG: OPT/YSL family transporter [Pirellulaceae bacterium]
MSSRYREVTVSSIVFGVIVGALMNASITYAGLKIGFTIGGSAIAAVLGFGVLRGLLRHLIPKCGSILETNIAQTVASAVNIPNSGIIFTVPVLYLLGYELSPTKADFWLITLACVAGAVLGAAFIIPLRKQMIDIDRLRFPTGTAVAAILKSPGAGGKKSVVLLAGALIAALLFLPTMLPSFNIGGKELPGYGAVNWRLRAPEPPPAGDLQSQTRYEAAMRRVDRDGDGQPDLIMTNDAIDVGRAIGLPDYVVFVFAIAPFSLGAGYITGRPGLLVLAGGVLAFFVLNPAMYLMGMMPAHIAPHEAASIGYGAFNRPLGIGMLLGGALMGVLFALPALFAAIKSIAAAAKSAGGSSELGFGVLGVAAVLCFLGLFLAADLIRGTTPPPKPDAAAPADGQAAAKADEAGNAAPLVADAAEKEPPAEQAAAPTGGLLSGLNHHLASLIIALVGGLWIWFAGIIIAQCTGMTDWSPISGMALITVVLIMALGGTADVMGAVLIGASLCVAVTCAADMMQDLKTGHIIGAQPKRQQIMELVATGVGPVISMLVLLVIVSVNLKQSGVPIGPGTKTIAPQAQALQAVIGGVQGGELPYGLYITGALLGIGLGLGSFPGLGVLVGLSMYLPISYILTYGLGCLANMVVERVKGKTWAEEWGVPFCAGLIVGEGVLALILNFILILTS